MEYTQWAGYDNIMELHNKCLNPCCNGIYSMRYLNCGFGSAIMS